MMDVCSKFQAASHTYWSELPMDWALKDRNNKTGLQTGKLKCAPLSQPASSTCLGSIQSTPSVIILLLPSH